jgi:PTH1 family peptidyl-tRNA hydrolase
MTWLVVGLGNPGAKYSRNRHNVGFMVLDELARKHGLPAWSQKLGGDATSGVITTERGRERAQLLKPMEFMNLSGFAVQRTMAFHRIELDKVLVVHDELDLDFGVVRLKNGGGHGGHNGLRSIIDTLGSDEFPRVRLGVRKGDFSGELADYVLGPFPDEDVLVVQEMVDRAADAVLCALGEGVPAAMNRFNGTPQV